jgi:sterol desaturase/sphingolipid hydroxylase (fatty acid hydroxylase superfamily)
VLPNVRELLYLVPALLVMLILMRIEVLLAHDVAGRRLDVFDPEKRLEYRLLAVIYFAHWLMDGSATTITVLIVNALGGGIIHLPNHGWWYVPSFLSYLVAFDFYLYLVHRANHKIPLLWSMHSLHHSATAMSATTGARHFWLETVVGAVCFAPFFGLLLNVPGNIAFPVVILNFFVGAVGHFNVPVRLGKWGLWLNNPQWHRIHHSRLPQHRDKNFANFFPIFDVIFGTAWIPEPHEFPDAGLDTADKPRTVLEGMIWPLRHYWRRWRSQTEQPAAVTSRAPVATEQVAVLEATSR